jgi:hypothetical protein
MGNTRVLYKYQLIYELLAYQAFFPNDVKFNDGNFLVSNCFSDGTFDFGFTFFLFVNFPQDWSALLAAPLLSVPFAQTQEPFAFSHTVLDLAVSIS